MHWTHIDLESKEEAANRPFVPLLVLSALSVAFAHGGNDVGNAFVFAPDMVASLLEVLPAASLQPHLGGPIEAVLLAPQLALPRDEQAGDGVAVEVVGERALLGAESVGERAAGQGGGDEAARLP